MIKYEKIKYIGTGAKAPLPKQYVRNRRAQKCRFSECHFSRSKASREIRSNDVDSSWTNEHLCTHQIHLSYITVLQHSIRDWTGKRDLRLGKLRKSIGSFCIRYGILWTLALLILQPFRRFTHVTARSPTLPTLYYVTAHSPTLPLLHIRHSSFSNASFAPSTSQAVHLRHLASDPWLVTRWKTMKNLSYLKFRVCTWPCLTSLHYRNKINADTK